MRARGHGDDNPGPPTIEAPTWAPLALPPPPPPGHRDEQPARTKKLLRKFPSRPPSVCPYSWYDHHHSALSSCGSGSAWSYKASGAIDVQPRFRLCPALIVFGQMSEAALPDGKMRNEKGTGRENKKQRRLQERMM